MSLVTIVMGSKSDLPSLKGAFDTFKEFGISYTARILSAHRTPDEVAELAKSAEANGTKVIICVAGMAAHLGGVVAAHTILPVIGVPMASPPFNGLDSLLAMVQMPPGVPVATVTAGPAGSKNAALLAIKMLALSDSELSAKLKDFQKRQAEKVLADDRALQEGLLD